MRLDPTPEGLRRARSALLGLLDQNFTTRDATGMAWRLVRMDPTLDDRHRVCVAVTRELVDRAASTSGSPADYVWSIDFVSELAQTPAARHEALRVLLTDLARHRSGHFAAVDLMDLIVGFAQTADDRASARDVLLGFLRDRTNLIEYGSDYGEPLVHGIIRLSPDLQDKRTTSNALLGLLSSKSKAEDTIGLARGLAQLNPSPEDKRRARRALIAQMTAETPAGLIAALTDALVGLEPTPEEKHQGRRALVTQMMTETGRRSARHLAEALLQLDPPPEELDQARTTLISLLAVPEPSYQPLTALLTLQPSAKEKEHARDMLLRQLAVDAGTRPEFMADLGPSTFLGSHTYVMVHPVVDLVEGLIRLDPVGEYSARARIELCRLLTTCTEIATAKAAVDCMIRLHPTAEDEQCARTALVRLTAAHGPSYLIDTLIQLRPTVADLRTWRTWPSSSIERAWPPITLLAAARRNSPLTAWLDALPTFAAWPA